MFINLDKVGKTQIYIAKPRGISGFLCEKAVKTYGYLFHGVADRILENGDSFLILRVAKISQDSVHFATESNVYIFSLIYHVEARKIR